MSPAPIEERALVAALHHAFTDDDPAGDQARRGRLAADAERDGLLDLSYRVVGSPHGDLLLVASAAGLVRVAFEVEGHDDVLASLAATISPRILRSPVRLEEVARQLDEYFSQRRQRLDVPLDLHGVSDFRRAVLDHLRTIEFGATESYAEVAAATGRPAAVRAVGSACSHNPVPLVVPCHRVVRSDGAIGQYLGGPEVKAALLDLERTPARPAPHA